ncbi:hypothetical protein EYR38_009200 [Pleurotus pulmonarius]|nr:hypothetical protein EYR38_009200 [Pleurotus pulmonarius]
MHGLPPEISSAIIAELDMDKPDDRKGLHSLLFVSKQTNPVALREIYKDISLDTWSYDNALGYLRSLSRHAARNPGLQFTAEFSFILKRGYVSTMLPHDDINRALGRIIPFLLNVRRVTISIQSGPVDVRIARSLPSCAPLTHLRLEQCSLSSGDLRQLLETRPTLEWLHISYSPNIPMPWRQIILPAGALPHLLSLVISLEDTMFLLEPLPSLINLGIDAHYMSQIDEASTVRRMAPYALVTSCRLTNIFDIDIAPIVTSLPNLEYLWVGLTNLSEERTPSATRLRYLRCCALTGPWTLGKKMFHYVKTLIVVDVTPEHSQKTMRLCHGKYQGPIFYKSGAWTRWWEDAEHAVELAGPRPANLSSIHG